VVCLQICFDLEHSLVQDFRKVYMNDIQRVTAFAPATVANVAVGFDILGFPIHAAGDTVTLQRRSDRRIIITDITGVDGCQDLPREPEKNVCSYVIQRLFFDQKVSFGVNIAIRKGIPLSSGMGGSAASSAAALTAANQLLQKPLSSIELLAYALLGEELATGYPHGDNVTPCLFGGFTLLRSIDPLKVEQLPVPENLTVALVHPHKRLDTRLSREALGSTFAIRDVTRQAALLAGFIAGCYTNDLKLIGESLEDVLVEPRRAPLIEGFSAVKEAALKAGALGMSLSGSGPSVFALCDGAARADRVKDAIVSVWEHMGIASEAWSADISASGAYVSEA